MLKMIWTNCFFFLLLQQQHHQKRYAISSLYSTLVDLFHSRSSKPSKSELVRESDAVPSKPKVTTLEDALNLFDEMLQRRPLPSVVRFNQLLGQLAKLKYHSAVISLNKTMCVLGIASDAYTLNIIINCYCHLKQAGVSMSVLGRFFKLGLQPDVTTFNTLINGFVLGEWSG
ncbi:hypothetical protein M0R45_019766 [Rubus argutus]|uniref:Pentatricopeptide repeat-containing protein n=1 Tax=Rubus argutus TaxID=59490 RepID=A0AAW1X8T8_RUBAR